MKGEITKEVAGMMKKAEEFEGTKSIPKRTVEKRIRQNRPGFEVFHHIHVSDLLLEAATCDDIVIRSFDQHTLWAV